MKNLSTYISPPLIIASFALANNLNAASYPYVGFSIGQATMEAACNESSGISGVSCEDSDTSFKVYGGAKIHQNFAFEVSYIDMGESVITDNVDTLTIEAAGLNSSVFGIDSRLNGCSSSFFNKRYPKRKKSLSPASLVSLQNAFYRSIHVL